MFLNRYYFIKISLLDYMTNLKYDNYNLFQNLDVHAIISKKYVACHNKVYYQARKYVIYLYQNKFWDEKII